jgi:hypothetical protein
MTTLKKIFALSLLCCSLSLAAFADETPPTENPNPQNTTLNATTAATQPVAADPSLVSSNQPIKQYNSEHCARKVCSRTDFGEVTCKCPTGIKPAK